MNGHVCVVYDIFLRGLMHHQLKDSLEIMAIKFICNCTPLSWDDRPVDNCEGVKCKHMAIIACLSKEML